MKNVIITGGTRGIGAACTRLFSKNGYRVFALYKNDNTSAKKISNETRCIPICTDICNWDEVNDVIQKISTEYKTIDLLINNAGIAEQKLFVDIMPCDWHKMIDVNLNGIYNVTHAVAKKMISQKSGSIINVSSIWGECGASCEVHYSAAKSGVIGFTKALAKELGLSGIRVNCITPGFIDTDMNSHLSKDEQEDIFGEIPLGRPGKCEECAQLIYFLASDDASYITGQTIGINGGWEM